MNIPPVSFGSLLVFTLDDANSASIPDLMKATFENNPVLSNYELTDTFEYTKKGDEDTVLDGTIWNSRKNFADELDLLHQNTLDKKPQKVILTSAEFTKNPRETRTLYFLTAATDKDEKKIHETLSKSSSYLINRFGYKKEK
jgi:hypothetical protein